VVNKKYLLELELSFRLNEVKRDFTTVDGACWLPGVNIPKELCLINIVSTDLDQFLLNLQHVIKGLLIDNFDAILIVNSDLFSVLIDLPLILHGQFSPFYQVIGAYIASLDFF